jgi:hypothetical protein
MWLLDAIMPLLSACYASSRGRNERDDDQSDALLQGISKALCAGMRTLPLLSLVSSVASACERLSCSTRDRERELACTIVLHVLTAVVSEWRERGKVVVDAGSGVDGDGRHHHQGVRSAFVGEQMMRFDGETSVECVSLQQRWSERSNAHVSVNSFWILWSSAHSQGWCFFGHVTPRCRHAIRALTHTSRCLRRLLHRCTCQHMYMLLWRYICVNNTMMRGAGEASTASTLPTAALESSPQSIGSNEGADFDIARLLAFLLPRCADPVEQVRLAATDAVDVSNVTPV